MWAGPANTSRLPCRPRILGQPINLVPIQPPSKPEPLLRSAHLWPQALHHEVPAGWVPPGAPGAQQHHPSLAAPPHALTSAAGAGVQAWLKGPRWRLRCAYGWSAAAPPPAGVGKVQGMGHGAAAHGVLRQALAFVSVALPRASTFAASSLGPCLLL